MINVAASKVDPHTPHTKQQELKQRFLGILRSTDAAGNVLYAARISAVGRRTAYEWRENDPEFAKKWDNSVLEGRETMKMEAERELRKLIKKGNLQAILFTLKTLGKSEWSETPQFANQNTQHNTTYYDYSDKEKAEFNLKFDEFFELKYGRASSVVK